MLRMETLDYRFNSFVNMSIKSTQGTLQELRELRAIIIQNRMVLDLLTAAQGGVCVIVNTTCCTYIPSEGEGAHSIQDALERMKQLQKIQIADHVLTGSGWFDWLGGGDWKDLVTKIAGILIVVLLCVSLLMCCVVPLIRRCINSMVTAAFGHQYMMLNVEDRESEYIELTKENPNAYDDIVPPFMGE